MLKVDLHSHTLCSPCGIHTHLELIAYAKTINLEAIAITDHGLAGQGLASGGRLPGAFYSRFKNPTPEVRVFKGIECNILDDKGTIDLIPNMIPKLDLVLLGIHSIPKAAWQGLKSLKGLSEAEYTDMLIAAIKKNPSIDIISHPENEHFPVNLKILSEVAAKHGIALEINNSSIALGKSTPERMMQLVQACKLAGCRISVNSDTHAYNELGDDKAVRPILIEAEFPESLIVNSSLETTLEFLEERRKNKFVKP